MQTLIEAHLRRKGVAAVALRGALDLIAKAGGKNHCVMRMTVAPVEAA